MKHGDHVLRNPNRFRRLTGISPVEFQTLVAQVAEAEHCRRARLAGQPRRQRKPGGGRKSKLSRADAVLMLLV